jgi:hypothetical protein
MMRPALVVPGVIAITALTLGLGMAQASPNVVGQKYSDASSALSSAGFAPVVSTAVGDLLPRAECVVTHQQDRQAKPPPNSGGSGTRQVLMFLNCEAPLAAPGMPGNSAASPEGRTEKRKEEAAKWKATTADGAQWCAVNQRAHPDWGASAFVGCPGT